MPEERPKIRGYNPPHNPQDAQPIEDEKKELNIIEALFMGVSLFIGILIALTGSFAGLAAAAVPIGLLYFAWPYAKRKALDKPLPAPSNPLIALHAYNTEFLVPLADNSTLVVTVHFQAPARLAIPPVSYSTPRMDSYFIDQLNRVTENLLIRFCQDFKDPPSKTDIEEHLQYNLLQFQNEQGAEVLRVNVPITIHKHPDKPKTVNV